MKFPAKLTFFFKGQVDALKFKFLRDFKKKEMRRVNRNSFTLNYYAYTKVEKHILFSCCIKKNSGFTADGRECFEKTESISGHVNAL